MNEGPHSPKELSGIGSVLLQAASPDKFYAIPFLRLASVSSHLGAEAVRRQNSPPNGPLLHVSAVRAVRASAGLHFSRAAHQKYDFVWLRDPNLLIRVTEQLTPF